MSNIMFKEKSEKGIGKIPLSNGTVIDSIRSMACHLEKTFHGRGVPADHGVQGGTLLLHM